MNAFRLSSFILSALCVFAAADARAEDKIWSAVILASNSPTPKAAPGPLAEVYARLSRVFKYNQFEILGSTTETVDEKVERWLVPTEHFWLSLKARQASAKEARGGYIVNLVLFHDKRQLVETEAKLAPNSPLFIRGPMHARGQILIVIQVQPSAL